MNHIMPPIAGDEIATNWTVCIFMRNDYIVNTILFSEQKLNIYTYLQTKINIIIYI